MIKSIVISGAGSGLGRAMSIALCAKGHKVVGLGRRKDALSETAGLAGAGFLPVICDVANEQAVRAAFETARSQNGPITTLINNAALYPRRDTLDETGQSFMETVSVNLGGLVNCTYAALPDMMNAGRGRILNVSTFADLNPLPASSAYSVSKGAARIFTRALIADMGDRFPDIVIGDWMPGMLATDMGIPEGLSPDTSASWGAALALWEDPTLTGSLFEQNVEILPSRGVKGKVKDLLMLRRRTARMIQPL